VDQLQGVETRAKVRAGLTTAIQETRDFFDKDEGFGSFDDNEWWCVQPNQQSDGGCNPDPIQPEVKKVHLLPLRKRVKKMGTRQSGS